MSTLNRVWDPSAGPGFVSWRTQTPDPNGIEYPGPGAFGSTSDYCVLRDTQRSAPAEAQLHGLDYNPVGLWQFNGNGNDAVGSANIDTVAAGTEQYRQGILPGTQALYLDGATKLTASSGNGPLQITGALTIEMLVKPLAPDYHFSSGGAAIVAMSGNGETAATNFCYQVAIEISDYNRLSSFHESGAGVNQQWGTDVRLTHSQWSHVAYTRTAGVDQSLYIDGALLETNSGLVAANDGSAGILQLGQAFGNGGGPIEVLLQSLKILDKVLTPAQVLEEARRCLPAGRRP